MNKAKINLMILINSGKMNNRETMETKDITEINATLIIKHRIG